LKCISAVGAELQHAAVEPKVGVLGRCFKVKVVPECKLRDVAFENRDIPRVEALVADYCRIIDEGGIGRCISRRDRYSGIRCDPQRRWTLCIYRYPVWGQCGRCHPVEVFEHLGRSAESWRTWRPARGNRSKNINPAPTSDIVWRTWRAALFIGDKMSRFIQYCPAAGNVVAQLWSGAPEQCHSASDVWRRHRRAAQNRIISVGAVVT
jgi:hypothetical protein